MTIMKITDKMAEAVLNAQPMKALDGTDHLKITSDVHDSTCGGLQNRGLVEYVKVTETMGRMVLSARGEAVRQMLTERPAQRGFGDNSLDRAETALAEVREPVQEPAKAEPIMESSDFGHLVGTKMMDRRGLRFKVDRVVIRSSRTGPCAVVSGRSVVSLPEPGYGTPDHPTYENSTWFDAYCSVIFYPGDEIPAAAEPVKPSAPKPPAVPAHVPSEESRRMLEEVTEIQGAPVTCRRIYRWGGDMCKLDRGHDGLHRTAGTGYISWTDTECVDASASLPEQVTAMISTQSAMNGKIYRSDGSVSPAPPAHSGRANVREVSKVLKAAGFTPRNGERIMARSGYQASQDGARVRVSWRAGVDTDLMGDAALDELRTAMNNAYATVLETAGYPVSERRYGDPAYVTGAKRKS